MAAGDTGNASGSAAAPSSSSTSASPAAQRAGMVQALEELARGERTAAKLEEELLAFESKLDSLLTSLGIDAADLEEAEAGEADTADKTDKMDKVGKADKTEGKQ